MTGVVTSGVCGVGDRQVRVASRQGSDATSVRGGAHLRQPRGVLEADSSGAHSSLPIDDAPSARAAGFLHASASGLLRRGEQQTRIDQTSKVLWRDLRVILQIWMQSYSTIG